MTSKHKDPSDSVARGEYNDNIASPGRLTFVGLRLLDPFVQYSLLAQPAAFLSFLPRHVGGLLLVPAVRYTSTVLGDLPLLPPFENVLLAMSVGTMLKQNFWVLAIGKENIRPGVSAGVALSNIFGNVINTSLAVWSLTSTYPGHEAAATYGSLFTSPTIAIGTALYTAGILIELVSEVQRSAFKSKPENEGRIYSGGLFSLSRHVNYFGYMLWRVGFATAAAGPLWGVAVGALCCNAFIRSIIPQQDTYGINKYGAQYEQFKKKVPYKLIPGLY